MKKLLLLFVLSISSFAFSQVPQGISYQAIALNGSGSPVVNSNVRVKLSILDTSATGTVLYSETQLKTTNAQGLFNVVIGQGTVVSGVFASINWGSNSKFLKVEMDATGGITYVAVGTTQLLSVPYAMHAGTVASIAGNSNINDEIQENKSENYAFVDNYDNKVYVYNSALGTWAAQTFNTDESPDVIGNDGDFTFVDNYDNKVYTYNRKTGVWTSQAFNTDENPTMVVANGIIGFVDNYDNKVYAYNSKTGTWSSQSFNTNENPDLVPGNGNIAFVDNYDNKVYVYNGRLGTWSSQSFNTNETPSLNGTMGNFMFVDNYDNKAYAYNGKTGVWTSQAFNTNETPAIITSETN